MKYFFYLFYHLLAKKLPANNTRLSFGFEKKLRNLAAKGFITEMGINVNIQKGANFSKSLEIGDNSSIGINSYCQGKVIIGKDVMMGPEVLIYTENHEHARTDIPMWKQGKEKEKAVIIEDDVWIGARVIILPGVRIGKGAILGAGAVVAKSIPDYAVAVGNPAKVIRFRMISQG